MVRFGVLLLFVVGMLAALAPAAAPQPQATQLEGNVGPGFVISLRDSSGAGISHMDPGTYLIHVVDQSDEHNFHLTGTGVDKATDIVGTGAQDWEITVVDGTYRYVCDAHATQMRGSFTVGNVPTPTPTRKLAGTVGPGAKISLARSAKAGKTIVTVRDLTKKDNFHLSGPGVNKKTGIAFKGTVKWTLMLKAGTYKFRSDAHRALKGTLKVTAAS
jgi:plastocyanin